MVKKRATGIAPNPLSYRFTVIDDTKPDVRDAYHALLRLSWPAILGIVVGVYLLLNVLFGALYWAEGGVANAQPGSFLDAFFFSVQTMGTIGYGAMYPTTRLANFLVVLESVTGLLITAIATGLVFVRFSRFQGRMRFGTQVAIGPMDGAPHLMVRIGNRRTNRIFDAQMRLTLVRTRKTLEGVSFYRNEDLILVRSYAPSLMRSWNLLHRIDSTSPLYGETAESLAKEDAELHAAVSGTDETTLQPVHGRYAWEVNDFVFGARLADVLSEDSNGNVTLDMRHFDEIVSA